MSYGAYNYSAPPPAYDEEQGHPLLNEEDDMFKETVANSSKEIRLQFVRKVYSILTTQLLVTTVLSGVYMSNDPVKHWVQSNQWLMLVSALVSIGILFLLAWKSRSVPLNYILLSVFTLLEGHAVGTVVTFYDQKIVLQALLITLGVFFGLTLFTLQSKWDFSGMAPFLMAGIWVMIIASIVEIFFPFSRGLQLAFAILGVILFSGYILFDTYNIFNRYSPEDYIMASVSLYLDIINLFLQILKILQLLSSDDN
ncbi:inhibitor of apoptosis-promoting Bax1-domain-containing protein [Pilobolus umbonatus]|nr:inhibitor of apoptosis-promoting Bax1-domain-containing protein [Pilobolus umbonatus]